MRIGIVCPYAWDVPGGVMAHVRDLALALMRHGHEVSVLAPTAGDVELPPWVVHGGRSVAVPYNGSVARLTFGVQATNRVRRWIKEGDFDVLHIHEPLAPSISILACWVAHGPIVATWHSSLDRSRVLSAGYYLAQTAMEKVRARIAVSELARRTIVDHIGGDAVLIPNGVDVSAFEVDETLPGMQRNGRTLMFLGRINEPRKGLQLLLEALPSILSRHPEARLLVAGPGDPDEALDGQPDAVQERVTFLGLVSEDDKVRAFHSADVYVAPNTGGESFGIVLLEAMASGAVVLASDLDAFRRVLDHGRAGETFANEDSADLAAKAIALLDEPGRRDHLRQAGYRRVRDYDWDTVTDEIIAVYESVRLPGEKVDSDLRGQLVGRLAWRGGQ